MKRDDEAEREQASKDPLSDKKEHPGGTAAGAAAAGAAGGAIGAAVAGPAGGIVGIAVGAVAGGMAGKAVAEKKDASDRLESTGSAESDRKDH